MKEAPVEERLKTKLECLGFKVLKLTTPGTNGTPDRLILRPMWSPGPPWVIELKAPKKHEARLQELVREEWRKRGVLVLDMVDTYEKVDALADRLHTQCVRDRDLFFEYVGVNRPRYCDFCGAPNETDVSPYCAPPFKVQLHQWTGRHPADKRNAS